MAASKHERFAILRRLAAVEASLSRLPFLPAMEDIGSRRAELSRERAELMSKLADKA
jgi:hypothetical protein